MRRILPQPLLSLVLLVSWLVINNSIHPARSSWARSSPW